MKQIVNQDQILKILNEDLSASSCDILILAGHFPLRVDPNTKKVYQDLHVWGSFSLYSLELALIAGENAKKRGKKVSILFLCDDQTYRDEDKHLLSEKEGLSEAQLDNRWRSARDVFYKENSGSNVIFAKEVLALFQKYNFSLQDVMKQDHGKVDREDCIFFSEAVLRNPNKITRSENFNNVAPCSREYYVLLRDYIDNNAQYLVSFIPNKCSHYVADVVDFFVKDFKGIHIFMDTFDYPSRDDMYKKGVFYKKN